MKKNINGYDINYYFDLSLDLQNELNFLVDNILDIIEFGSTDDLKCLLKEFFKKSGYERLGYIQYEEESNN